MRHASPLETPSLFTPELLNGDESTDVVANPEKSTDANAREFVRWCWSFGSDFHNSPDITNLRSWLRKGRLSPSASEEEEILVEARRLFLKRVEQAVRKADVPKGKD
jgi:hypothetical protein